MELAYDGAEQTMRQMMQQMLAGKPVSPEQQRFLDAMPSKFVALMRQEFNWATMKPRYVTLYTESFEQDEVDGLIAFYQCPTGQAFLSKMPAVCPWRPGGPAAGRQAGSPRATWTASATSNPVQSPDLRSCE